MSETLAYSLHLHCKAPKDAPTIVFLHGLFGSGRDFDPVIKELESFCHCMTIDLPGHGESLFESQEAYSFDACIRRLQNTLNLANVSKPYLAGYSMGGRVALYSALCTASEWAGLFLISSNPGITDLKEKRVRRRKENVLAERIEIENLGDFLEEWYSQEFFSRLRLNEESWSRLKEKRMNNQSALVAKSLRFMGSGVQPSLWDDLSKLNIPCHVIVGKEDSKYCEIAHEMVKYNPDVKVHEIADCGHNVVEENNEAFIEILKEELSHANNGSNGNEESTKQVSMEEIPGL